MDTEDDKKVRQQSSHNNLSNKKQNYHIDSEGTSENDDFYANIDLDNKDTKIKEKKPFNKKILIIISLLVIIVLILLFLLFYKNEETVLPKIKLLTKDISLNVGESKYVSYEIINTDEVVDINFQSMDENIATVDNNGSIKGIGSGVTNVKLLYKSGKTNMEEICNVTVVGNGNSGNNDNVSQAEPTLNLVASSTEWTNSDVIIKVTYNSNANGNVTAEYTTNCTNNCKYTMVSNNSIIIKNSGTSNVTVIATDSINNKSTTKSITVKIDKTNPTATLKSTNIYSSNANIKVCATCSDKESGCKQNEYCKTYTASATNQVITVYDKAGNKANTKTFNVTINKTPLSCKLSVNESGLVTVTNIQGNPTYYGFSSSYSGANETTKQLTDSATVTYYMKNNIGDKKTYTIKVTKDCKCLNKIGGKCYKDIVNSCAKGVSCEQCSKCNGNCSFSNSDNRCYVYGNEGKTCTFKQAS